MGQDEIVGENSAPNWQDDAKKARMLEKLALTAIGNGVLITDPSLDDNPIIYSNPGFTRLTGYRAEEILGSNCRFLQGPDTDPAGIEEIRFAIQQERACRVTLLNYKSDMTPFWNELVVSPVRVNGGDGEMHLYFIGVQTDVTERVEAEEAHRAAERSALERSKRLAAIETEATERSKRLATIFESMSDGFLALDEQLNIEYMNPNAEKMMRRPLAKLLGHNIWEAYPSAAKSGFFEGYHTALREQREVVFEEFYPPFDTWYKVRVFPYDHGLSVFIQDVTEEHLVKEERERLRREREEEHQEIVRRERFLLKEVLYSVTEGKLCMCDSAEEFPVPLPDWGPRIIVDGSDALSAVRQQVRESAQACNFPNERWYDLMGAASEAAMNALQHGGGGEVQVTTCDTTRMIQIWVTDQGHGIRLEELPRATLMQGHSGAGTLGHGFWLMLQGCDRLYLLTGPTGTTIVMEAMKDSPEPAWLIGNTKTV